MTRIVRVAVIAILLASLLATASCDSNQPLQVEGQQLDIQFNAFPSSVPKFRVWRMSVTDIDGVPLDVNGDGEVNEGDVTLWCERSAAPGNPASVPWDYSFKVSVLRAGSAVPEVLTSDLAATPAGNKAPYDETVSSFTGGNPSSIVVELPNGECSNNPDRFCNPASSGNSCGSGTCEARPMGTFCSGDNDTACDPDFQSFNPCMAQDKGICIESDPPDPKGEFGVCSEDPGATCFLTICADAGKGQCVTDYGRLVPRRFFFEAATKAELTAASQTVLDAGPNTLTDLCAGDVQTSDCGQYLVDVLGEPGMMELDPLLGECPGDPAGVLGTPVMDPQTQDINPSPTIFGVDLKKGDTIIVEARLSLFDIPGGGGVLNFTSPPGLQAVVSVDGVQLLPSEVVGNLSSAFADGAAVTFSYTSQ